MSGSGGTPTTTAPGAAAPAAAPQAQESWGQWIYNRLPSVFQGAAQAAIPRSTQVSMAAEALRTEAAKPNGNPAGMIFDRLAQQPQFREGTQARTELDRLRNDPNFEGIRTSLNNAIRRNPTMIAGFAEAAIPGGSGNNQLNPVQLVHSLQDPGNRQTMGRVLDAVADRPNLGGFSYLQRVATRAAEAEAPNLTPAQQRERRQALRGTLAEAGVRDNRLELASMSFMDIMRNPGAAIGAFMPQLREMFGASGANMAAGGLNGLATMLSTVFSPEGPILGHYVREFGAIGRRVGANWEQDGARIAAAADRQAGGAPTGQAPAAPAAQRRAEAAPAEAPRTQVTSVEPAANGGLVGANGPSAAPITDRFQTAALGQPAPMPRPDNDIGGPSFIPNRAAAAPSMMG